MTDDKLDERDDEKPRLKVTDRRKFTADGKPRVPDEDEPSEREQPAERPSPGATASAPPADEGTGAARPADSPPRPVPPSSTSDGEGPQGASESREAPAAGGASATGGPAGATAPGAAAGRARIADLPRDFTSFVEGMYLEAMLYLGALPDPRTGEVVEDLDLAKYKIDQLGMLQEKTRGNLTDEEHQQLEEVLYQLRMFYVQKSDAAGAS